MLGQRKHDFILVVITAIIAFILICSFPGGEFLTKIVGRYSYQCFMFRITVIMNQSGANNSSLSSSSSNNSSAHDSEVLFLVVRQSSYMWSLITVSAIIQRIKRCYYPDQVGDDDVTCLWSCSWKHNSNHQCQCHYRHHNLYHFNCQFLFSLPLSMSSSSSSSSAAASSSLLSFLLSLLSYYLY